MRIYFSMQKRKYITTTLPYVNSRPHIGHAFEFILADALARYYKYSGHETFFNIGLDEHGLKIQQAAEAKGITPQEHVDNLLYDWEDFIEKLQINSWDSFYRTSEEEHVSRVKQFWKEAVERGDIYKKKYSGKYCVGCESFKTDRDLVDSKCPDHPTTDLQEIEEENYFFKLSKYRNQLHKWAYNATDFVKPAGKRGEFLKFIDTIEDISISRLKETVQWGVPVPGDSTQTIYVWFDALLNYIFAAGYYPGELYDDHDFKERWEESDVIQICGPDNLKFQAVIFQALLESAGIKHTDRLIVHGTILDKNGRKMAKSVGNVVDPIDQINKYGVEAVRYYALAGITTYGNSAWDEKRLVELYNSNLADDYGNLVARVTHLAGKILSEYEEDPNIELDYSYVREDKFCTGIDEAVKSIKWTWEHATESHEIFDALFDTNQLVKLLNKHINDEKPWEDTHKGWTTILELHYALNKINELYYPVIPGKVGEVRKALRECKKAIIFPKLELVETV